jgi:hypothetical protein
MTPADASTDRVCAGTVAGRLMLWFAFLSVHAFCEPRSTCTRSEVTTCVQHNILVQCGDIQSQIAVPGAAGDVHNKTGASVFIRTVCT